MIPDQIASTLSPKNVTPIRSEDVGIKMSIASTLEPPSCIQDSTIHFRSSAVLPGTGATSPDSWRNDLIAGQREPRSGRARHLGRTNSDYLLAVFSKSGAD